MARFRSRHSVSRDVNTRRLADDAVTFPKMRNRGVREIKQWPGFRRPLRPRDFGPEVWGEIDGRGAGETVTLPVVGVDGDGFVRFGFAVSGREYTGFPTVGELGPVASFDAYYDATVALLAEGHAGADVGFYRGSELVGEPLEPTYPWRELSAVGRYSVCAPGDQLRVWTDHPSVVGGHVTFELKEHAKPEPVQPPSELELVDVSELYRESESTATIQAPDGVQQGDMMLVLVGRVESSWDADLPPAPSANLTPLTGAWPKPGSREATARAWWKRAEAGDVSQTINYTVESTGSTVTGLGIAVVVLRASVFGSSGNPFGAVGPTEGTDGEVTAHQHTAPAGGEGSLVLVAGNRAGILSAGWHPGVADTEGVEELWRTSNTTHRHAKFAVGWASPGAEVTATWGSRAAEQYSALVQVG